MASFPLKPHIKPSRSPSRRLIVAIASSASSGLRTYTSLSAVHSKSLIAGKKMDPISIEKIKAMKKYRRSRKQQQKLLPALTPYMVATCVLCLLLTSPAWFPWLCSLLVSFLLTTLPDLATAFLLSPKCLFVVGNLIVAFLIGESRLSFRSQSGSLVDVDGIHEEHVKKNIASTTAKAATTATTAVFSDHSALVGVVWEGEEEEVEEQEEEELEKRVDDFIARVRRQRKLEAKSFFDTDR